MSERDELIRRLTELEAKATPGPWGQAEGNFIVAYMFRGEPSSGKIVAEVPCQGANDDDLPFVVALRNAWSAIKAALAAQGREP